MLMMNLSAMPTEQQRGCHCASCDAWITYTGTGRRPQYCSASCRQRAYVRRTAQARGKDRSARDRPESETASPATAAPALHCDGHQSLPTQQAPTDAPSREGFACNPSLINEILLLTQGAMARWRPNRDRPLRQRSAPFVNPAGAGDRFLEAIVRATATREQSMREPT